MSILAFLADYGNLCEGGKFAARVMKFSLRFCVMYTKAELFPIFVGGLSKNLHGVVCQMLSEASNISYKKTPYTVRSCTQDEYVEIIRFNLDYAVLYSRHNAKIVTFGSECLSYDDIIDSGHGIEAPVLGGQDDAVTPRRHPASGASCEEFQNGRLQALLVAWEHLVRIFRRVHKQGSASPFPLATLTGRASTSPSYDWSSRPP